MRTWVVVFVLIVAPHARAQTAPDSLAALQPHAHSGSTVRDTQRFRWEIDPYVGAARHSPGGPRLGLATDRDHRIVGVHIVRKHPITKRISIGYAMEAVPLLIVTNNPTGQVRFINDHLRVRVIPMTSSVAGYKFHHISNGGFASSNLGVDGNVFLVGTGWALGAR